MDGPGIDIESCQCLIVAGEHCPPDVIDWIIGTQKPYRWMRDKTDVRLILRIDGCKRRQVERLGVRRMEHATDRPFKPRDVGEIGERGRGRKVAQEVRKFAAVPVEVSLAGRMGGNEALSCAVEEVGADQALHDWKGESQ